MNQKKKEQHIDLHLPRSWRELTTEQLEDYALALTTIGKEGWENPMLTAKFLVFFRWNQLTMLRPMEALASKEDQAVSVRHHPTGKVFEIPLWQIIHWTEERLKWMDEPMNILFFPYSNYTKWSWKGKREYQGPDLYMQNFSYEQYRLAGEYISLYVMENNRMARLIKEGLSKENLRALRMQKKRVEEVKALFLATIYNKRVCFIDKTMGVKRKDFKYVSNQTEANYKDFLSFQDIPFQVVLFWWVSMMGWLQSKLPKVFKKTEVRSSAPTNPLDVYRQTMVVLEKYLTGMNEERINNELYMNILQHLQNIMDESDRMKELDRR